MWLASTAQIRRLDELSPRYGVDTWSLMRNAGRAAYHRLLRVYPLRGTTRVLVLCGKGNNGGDGFVLASHLQGVCRLHVACTADISQLRGDAARAAKRFLRLGGKVAKLGGAPRGSYDLIVDALLGTGAAGELRSPYRELSCWINDQTAKVYALDIPTGACADTGRVDSVAVRADWTVTFGLAKTGLLLYPAREHVGKLYVADIGYPDALLKDHPTSTFLAHPGSMTAYLLAPRHPNSHKGTYGHLFVAGGSPGLVGAVAMAAEAALRAGAGLVTLLVPGSIYPLVATRLKEAMASPLPDASSAAGKGGWQAEAAQALLTRLLPQASSSTKPKQALVLGPGMGRGAGVRGVVRRVVRDGQWPLLLDADGINALAGEAERLRSYRGSLVLTPHPQEAARLAAAAKEEVLRDPLGFAKRLAKETGSVVVLKTFPVIVSDGERTGLLDGGHPGMATGGMGDVLSGVIGAFLAQGLPAFRAAVLGVYLLQKAGELAGRTKGAGLVASDVIFSLPRAMLLYGSR